MNNQEILTLAKLFVLIIGVIVALVVSVANMRNDIKEARN